MNKTLNKEKKMRKGYWPAYVLVSKSFPDTRFSRFFDTRKEARNHLTGHWGGHKGLKILSVRVFVP